MNINWSKLTARKSSTYKWILNSKECFLLKYSKKNQLPQMDAHALEPILKQKYKPWIKIKVEEKQGPRCVLRIEVCHKQVFQRRLKVGEGLRNKNKINFHSPHIFLRNYLLDETSMDLKWIYDSGSMRLEGCFHQAKEPTPAPIKTNNFQIQRGANMPQ